MAVMVEKAVAKKAPVVIMGDFNCDICDDYRHILVLPVVVKVLERLGHRQLYTYLQENNLLHPTQFEFKPGHST